MSLHADRLSLWDRAGSHVALAAVILLCFTWFASVVFGQDEAVRGASHQSSGGMRLPPRSGSDSAPATRKSSPASTDTGLWTTAIALVVIVGVLGFVGYWLRPYLGVPRGLPIDALELLGRRVIEQKVAIHLVRCGGRVLVVGVSPEGARTLSEISDPAEVQRLLEVCHAPRATRPLSALIPSVGGSKSHGPGGQERSAVASSGARGTVPRASSFQTGDMP